MQTFFLLHMHNVMCVMSSMHMFCNPVFVGSFSLPFLKEAHQQCTDIEALSSLDKLCEACMSNHVAKRASTRQVCVYIAKLVTTYNRGNNETFIPSYAEFNN